MAGTFWSGQAAIRPDETFGQWVKRRRAALDLSRDNLAYLVGCAEETIRKIERDQRRPSRQIAELLAVHLQVPLEDRPEFIRFARGKTLEELVQTTDTSTVLPVSINPLIGRQADMEALRLLLAQPQVRLVTLSGPPGVGKTRLAVALASAVKDGFSSGIGYVDLASITQVADVIPAIAQSLGVKDVPNLPIRQTLRNRLRGQQMLLVLDNFEQVVEAAPELLDLLQNAPKLKLLVTSRMTLNVAAEHLYAVAPLNSNDAVALFCLRAQAVQPGFQRSAGNASTIEGLCHRLDGLPLAIELAASRLRLFTPEALLSNLSISLSPLHGQRDLPGRQQTLREAIAWSYNLLDEDFKAVFRRLSVFAGGCTLEAAAAICELPQDEMADALVALLDASLIQLTLDVTHERRFRMLALIQEYAIEQLKKANEVLRMSQRHAIYFLQQAETAQTGWLTNSRTHWMDVFRADHDNLHAALTWAQHNRPVVLVQLAGALMWFWRNAGYWHEGRTWLKEANRAARDLQLNLMHPAECARAIQAEGVLAWEQCDIAAAEGLLAQAVESYQRLEMSTEWAYTLVWSGIVAAASGLSDRTQQYFQHSLALFEEAQDRKGLAFALTWFSAVQMRAGKIDESLESIQKAFEIWELLEDDWGRAGAHLMLATLSLFRGNFHQTETHLKQGLSFAQQAGDVETLHTLEVTLAYVQMCAGNLELAEQNIKPALHFYLEQGTDPMAMSIVLILAATIDRELGKNDEARRYLLDCLKLQRDSQNSLCIYWCLHGLAAMTKADHTEQAIKLWSAAETCCPEPLQNILGLPLSPYESRLYERDRLIMKGLRQGSQVVWQASRQNSLVDLLGDLIHLEEPG